MLHGMLGGHVWRVHAPHPTGIHCGEVLIAGRYRGLVFQGDEPAYPPAQVEILSDHISEPPWDYAMVTNWSSHS